MKKNKKKPSKLTSEIIEYKKEAKIIRHKYNSERYKLEQEMIKNLKKKYKKELKDLQIRLKLNGQLNIFM